MQKLLGTANVDLNTKPTEVLQNLRNLAGAEINDTILQEMWLSKIRPDIRLDIASIQSSISADALAKIADDVYDVIDAVKAHTHSGSRGYSKT